MREFTELTSISQADTFIAENQLAFLYISRNNCSVCHALLPQVKKLMDKFPDIQLGHIVADNVEEVAGRFSVFTVPVLLLFAEGKEYVREARIVHMDKLEEKIERIYANIGGT
jgi:thioredoxin-like negative regulator of GroEL